MTTEAEQIPDGQIEPDSEAGRLLGFTSDRFEGYLWRFGDAIVISYIVSRRKGNFRGLVERIRSIGLAVEVPTPLPRMRAIVEKNGYLRCEVNDPIMGHVEVWRLEPPKKGESTEPLG